MSDLAIGIEFAQIRARTRRWIGGSAVIHLLLVLLLVLHHTATTASSGFTEITWVEAAAPAPEETAPPLAQKETKTAPIQEVAQKPSRLAQAAPEPRSSASVEDVMARRLESLQRSAAETETRMAALVPPPRVGMPSAAGVPVGASRPGAPGALRRDKTGQGGTPAELKRLPAPATPSAAVAPALPKPESSTSRQLARSDARRDVAGAQLAGPVADRALVNWNKPGYPEWAKRDGVEGSVTIYFSVLADGKVKENVLVEKTSGFQDFDRNSVDALRTWRFEPLAGTGEQWGRITFHFRLTDAS